MVKSIYCNILLIWTLTFSHRSLPGRYFGHVIIFIISCLGLGGTMLALYHVCIPIWCLYVVLKLVDFVRSKVINL